MDNYKIVEVRTILCCVVMYTTVMVSSNEEFK